MRATCHRACSVFAGCAAIFVIGLFATADAASAPHAAFTTNIPQGVRPSGGDFSITAYAYGALRLRATSPFAKRHFNMGDHVLQRATPLPKTLNADKYGKTKRDTLALKATKTHVDIAVHAPHHNLPHGLAVATEKTRHGAIVDTPHPTTGIWDMSVRVDRATLATTLRIHGTDVVTLRFQDAEAGHGAAAPVAASATCHSCDAIVTPALGQLDTLAVEQHHAQHPMPLNVPPLTDDMAEQFEDWAEGGPTAMPFFLLHGKGYSCGLVLLTALPGSVVFSGAHGNAKRPNAVQWRLPRVGGLGDHDYLLLPGPHADDVRRQWLFLTGRPPLPPIGALGATVRIGGEAWPPPTRLSAVTRFVTEHDLAISAARVNAGAGNPHAHNTTAVRLRNTYGAAVAASNMALHVFADATSTNHSANASALDADTQPTTAHGRRSVLATAQAGVGFRGAATRVLHHARLGPSIRAAVEATWLGPAMPRGDSATEATWDADGTRPVARKAVAAAVALFDAEGLAQRHGAVPSGLAVTSSPWLASHRAAAAVVRFRTAVEIRAITAARKHASDIMEHVRVARSVADSDAKRRGELAASTAAGVQPPEATPEVQRDDVWRTTGAVPPTLQALSVAGHGALGASLRVQCDREHVIRAVQLACALPLAVLPDTCGGDTSLLEWLASDAEAKDKVSPAVAAIRAALQQRLDFTPYLVTVFAAAHFALDPVLTPLFIAAPRQPLWLTRHTTYLLGDSVAVRPTVEFAPIRVLASRTQEDRWYVYPSGEEIASDMLEQMRDAGLGDNAVVLLRGGHVVPLLYSDTHRRVSATVHAPLQLVVALDTQNTSAGVVYFDDGSGMDAAYSTGNYRVYQTTATSRRIEVVPRTGGMPRGAYGANMRPDPGYTKVALPSPDWFTTRVVKQVVVVGLAPERLSQLSSASLRTWRPEKPPGASTSKLRRRRQPPPEAPREVPFVVDKGALIVRTTMTLGDDDCAFSIELDFSE